MPVTTASRRPYRGASAEGVVPVQSRASAHDELANTVFLARSVADAELPARIVNWASREGLGTLRELALRDPEALREEPNLGRKTIAQTSDFFRAHTGSDWPSLHRELHGAQEPVGNLDGALSRAPSTDLEVVSWASMPSLLSAELLALRLHAADLPTRMLNHCERAGLKTLADLLAVPESDLLETKNLGRSSLRDTRRALARLHHAVLEASSAGRTSPLAPRIEDYSDFHTLWRKRVGGLSANERLVLTQRVGNGGVSPTLLEIGELLGVSRERVRQLESSAIENMKRESWMVDGIVARVEDAFIDGAVSLRTLAEDPWFQGIEQRPEVLRFVLTRLDDRLHLESGTPDTYISGVREGAMDAVLQDVLSLLRRRTFPCARTEVDVMIAERAAGLPRRFVQLIGEQVAAALHASEIDGCPVYTGFGDTRGSAVLAYVRASDIPVSVHAIEAEFGRGALPDAVVHVARGAVMAPERIPEFALWQERLAPACVRLMERDGPTRQWSTEELLELLPGVAQLPTWLTWWHLAGMLRLSGQVRYLGRQRVCLLSDRREAREYIHEIAREELLKAGGPLPEPALRELVTRRTAVPDLAWNGLVSGVRGGVVRVDPERFGLIERDVLGGEEAYAEAAEILRDALGKRETGLSVVQAHQVLAETDPRYGGYTLTLVHALARRSPHLRTAANGSVGLVEWEDVRVPGMRELIRSALQAGGGRADLAEVTRRIATLHGAEPSRANLVSAAIAAGGRLRGSTFVDVALLNVQPPVTSAAVSSATGLSLAPRALSTALEAPRARDIPNFPGLSVEVFDALMVGPHEDVAGLRLECLAHLASFEREAAVNEFVSVHEARLLTAACVALLESIGPRTADAERRLICATTRYFVLTEDGDNDFSIGGLDDDLAVLQAVLALLGREELLDAPVAQSTALDMEVPGGLESEHVPRANRIDRVVERVLAAIVPTDSYEDLMLLDADCYAQAAQILGLLDAGRAPTSLGRAVANAESDELRALLAQALKDSLVGRRWLAYAGLHTMAELDAETAHSFLAECSVLSPSIAASRAGTLIKWWHELFTTTTPLPPSVLNKLTAVSEEDRQLVGRLSSAPLESDTSLLAAVRRHLQQLRTAAPEGATDDIASAEAIGRGLEALASRTEESKEDARRMFQAAVRYFLLVDDADTGMRLGGFANSVVVYNSVARALDCADLLVRTR